MTRLTNFGVWSVIAGDIKKVPELDVVARVDLKGGEVGTGGGSVGGYLVEGVGAIGTD